MKARKLRATIMLAVATLVLTLEVFVKDPNPPQHEEPFKVRSVWMWPLRTAIVWARKVINKNLASDLSFEGNLFTDHTRKDIPKD